MMEKLCKQWLDSQRFDWDVLMNNSLITNLINTAANQESYILQIYHISVFFFQYLLHIEKVNRFWEKHNTTAFMPKDMIET